MTRSAAAILKDPQISSDRRLEQRERIVLIGETITEIAHSIKNMLGMIKGGEYQVETGLRTQDMKRVREGWETVKVGNRYIADLVLKMLTLCRDSKPAYEEIGLEEIIESVTSVLRAKVKARGVQLEIELNPKDISGVVDVSCMREALLNLVDNAIDASPKEDGCVEIGAVMRSDGAIELYVEDNGRGIPPEMRDSLFVPFFTTKGEHGNGLGIPVAEKIVHEHGGELIIETGRSGGARFVMRLPGRVDSSWLNSEANETDGRGGISVDV